MSRTVQNDFTRVPLECLDTHSSSTWHCVCVLHNVNSSWPSVAMVYFSLEKNITFSVALSLLTQFVTKVTTRLLYCVVIGRRKMERDFCVRVMDFCYQDRRNFVPKSQLSVSFYGLSTKNWLVHSFLGRQSHYTIECLTNNWLYVYNIYNKNLVSLEFIWWINIKNYEYKYYWNAMDYKCGQIGFKNIN